MGALRFLSAIVIILTASILVVITTGCAMNGSNSAVTQTPPGGQFTVTPTTVSFGNVTVGNAAARSVVISNNSASSVTISQVNISGSSYNITGLNAPLTLAAGASAWPTITFAPTAANASTGSISFVTTAGNSPEVVGLSGVGQTSSAGTVCGPTDDGLVHLPPNYTCGLALCVSLPFPPPSRGASYADPAYGCTVTRLTDAQGDGLGAAAHHQYSTINPINANDAFVVILLENGSLEIIDTSGGVVVPVANFPRTSSGNVPWDISTPTRFYYTAGAAILRADIGGLPGCASSHSCTITSTTLHDFAGIYTSVQIPDQEDISDDGDHLWLVGDTKAFLYTISSNSVGPAMNVGTKDTAGGWHKIEIMPSNRMLMTWSANGSGPGAGQEVYNIDAMLNWHMFDNTVHTDCGRDLHGNEVCVVARIPDTGGNINGAGACPTWTGTQDGGTDVIDMSTHKPQCLVDVHWADTEVSFRDGNANAGWVLITFFKSGSCPTYSCFDALASHLDLTWTSDWVHFAEEGILVPIDNNNGPNTHRLFHTRSRSTEYYWAIPRGAISRDGKYVVFDSNFDISNTGLVNYTDVYATRAQ